MYYSKLTGFSGIFMLIILVSCNKPKWTGKYVSRNCMVVEYVELYQDRTADVRYFGSSYPTNHKLYKENNIFYVDFYVFEYREDGMLYEISGYDPGCQLEKDTTVTVWDKILQP